MRKVITKIGIVCSFLILVVQLTSCDNSTEKVVSTAIEVAEVMTAKKPRATKATGEKKPRAAKKKQAPPTTPILTDAADELSSEM